MAKLLDDPKQRVMRPDEVLSVFHQGSMIEYQCTLEKAIARLGRTSSIYKLREEIDFYGNWKTLGDWLNTVFNIDLPHSAWKQYLQWPRRRNVGVLCDFISQYALIEQIEPAEILGRSCLEAGVFRTIVSMLKHAGADISNLSPSTCVGSFIRDYSKVFYGDLGKIAPGAIPGFEGMVHEQSNKSIWDVVALTLFSIPFVVTALSLLLSIFWPPLLMVAFLAMSTLSAVVIVGILWSMLIEYIHPYEGDRRTFKQLCCVVAETMRSATSSVHHDRLREAVSG